MLYPPCFTLWLFGRCTKWMVVAEEEEWVGRSFVFLVSKSSCFWLLRDWWWISDKNWFDWIVRTKSINNNKTKCCAVCLMRVWLFDEIQNERKNQFKIRCMKISSRSIGVSSRFEFCFVCVYVCWMLVFLRLFFFLLFFY